MDTNAVVLIIGLVVVAAVTLLVWRGQTLGAGMEASFSLAEFFSASLTLTSGDTAQAEDAVRAAAAERGSGEPGGDGPHLGDSTTLARVLWVDDNPDNNIYETVALEKLGKFVTKATSTSAALAYLSRMDFAILITDLGRWGGPCAGLDLVRRLRANGYRMPIVVYTTEAAPARESLLAAGADAVVDLPGTLVREVEERVRKG